MDWEVLFPALAFTISGAFIQGLHATSMFVLALGLMLLPGGLFKGGTPRPRGVGLAVVVTLATMTTALGILFIVLNL